MLREYIISEAMHYLKIPTTRSLSVVKTGESILRESKLQGAVLTRVRESSHLRVGTFQFVASNQDIKTLSELVNYTVERHFPGDKNNKNLALELFKKVFNGKLILSQIGCTGFVHGVWNTDGIRISGETIDYGPCIGGQLRSSNCF